jgi:hypothetical protein
MHDNHAPFHLPTALPPAFTLCAHRPCSHCPSVVPSNFNRGEHCTVGALSQGSPRGNVDSSGPAAPGRGRRSRSGSRAGTPYHKPMALAWKDGVAYGALSPVSPLSPRPRRSWLNTVKCGARSTASGALDGRSARHPTGSPAAPRPNDRTRWWCRRGVHACCLRERVQRKAMLRTAGRRPHREPRRTLGRSWHHCRRTRSSQKASSAASPSTSTRSLAAGSRR